MTPVTTTHPRLADLYPAMGPRVLHRLPGGAPSRPYELFTVVPGGPLIGAEISGVDLSRPLEGAVVAELNRALLEWKVLVLRDQHITLEQQTAFAAHWGAPFEAALFPGMSSGRSALGYQNYWHADDTFRPQPGLGAVLRLTEVPLGGDTLFADMAAAYDNLTDDTKAAIEGRSALHDCRAYATVMYGEAFDAIRDQYPAVPHPVVRTHPETGRATLYVNAQWTTAIVGLPEDDSARLLLHLTMQATVPEYQCRVRWQPHTLVIWDNRAVQHYAVSDYDGSGRAMVRVAITGDTPY
jgi:taurine dioxygenase